MRADIVYRNIICDNTYKHMTDNDRPLSVAFQGRRYISCLAVALLFIFLIVLTTEVSATAPAIAWNKTYQAAESTVGQRVISTDDGYLIAGYYIIMYEGSGIALIKTDFDGNEAWNRTYGDFDVVSSMIAVSDGYVITGIKPYPDSVESRNAFLARIDRSGNMTWWKAYGGRVSTRGSSVIPVEGGYVMAGMFGWSSLPGVYTDAYLVRTDSEGNEIWNRTYGSPGSDDEFATVIESGDGYVLAGDIGGSIWVVRTDPDGNEIWNRTYGTGGGYAIIKASDGYVFLADKGRVDNSRFVDFHLMKIDVDGNMIWDRKLGKYLSGSLAAVPDGYALTGGIDLSGNWTYQVYLMKTDLNGNQTWNVTCAMAGSNIGSALIVDRGAYVIAGGFHSVGNTTPNYSAALLVKTNRDNSRAMPAAPAASLVLTTLAVIIATVAGRLRK
ncbi:MAG: hypothetical protein WBZ29_04630 [Methanocella sp.]